MIAIGPQAIGIAAAGGLAVGVLFATGIGVSAFRGPGLVYGLFGRLSGPRLRAWLGLSQHDRVRFRWSRLALGFAGTIVAGIGCWFGVGLWL